MGGGSGQGAHDAVSRYYELPVISVREAVWPAYYEAQLQYEHAQAQVATGHTRSWAGSLQHAGQHGHGHGRQAHGHAPTWARGRNGWSWLKAKFNRWAIAEARNSINNIALFVKIWI